MGNKRKTKSTTKRQPTAERRPVKETDGPAKTRDTVHWLDVDGQRLPVHEDDLCDTEKLSGLANQLRGANVVVVENLDRLIAIPRGRSNRLLHLLSDLPQRIRLIFSDEQMTDVVAAGMRIDADLSETPQADRGRIGDFSSVWGLFVDERARRGRLKGRSRQVFVRPSVVGGCGSERRPNRMEP
jgi:hypothetical protein